MQQQSVRRSQSRVRALRPPAMACATHTITTASGLTATTSRSRAAATALPGSSDAHAAMHTRAKYTVIQQQQHAVLGTSIAYADCAAALTAATASNLAAPVASVHPIATALPWQRHSARRPHSRGRSIPRSFDSLPAQLPCAVFRTRSSLPLRYRRCRPHWGHGTAIPAVSLAAAECAPLSEPRSRAATACHGMRHPYHHDG